ncbi:MAG: SDR family oxidoreductase [Sphingobium sp.]|uniref:SDR family NAD(P)-dependent oxidoreductase n=1 Tax=Sphingobium sp. TaxID=1912891 RepID=UPI0029A609A4|nr:SDR family oxidoreductase [Sphingobium sp.]MDX3909546.1 SDR family oxidoreductase [Sphingobium sp.]
MARLIGKAGLITAAASGMGRAGALRFAAEGAKVAVVDRDAQKADETVDAIVAAGGTAFAIAGDLTDDAFARSIVAETIARFGALNYVWNHAGHPGPSAFEDVDMAIYELAMDLNIRVPTVVAGAAITHMREHGGGSIVFTASGSGIVASPFSPIYSAAKFGVVGLTRALAKRYGKDNIRCNSVCPGAVDTPMLREFQQRPDAPKTGVDVEDTIAKFGSMNPMGRNGRPDEIAAAALFLVSDDASYVNGATLAVDGGMTA